MFGSARMCEIAFKDGIWFKAFRLEEMDCNDGEMIAWTESYWMK